MINVLGRAKQTSCKKYTVIYLQNIKINKSTVKGDIPANIIRDFAKYICYPYADLLNSMIIHGKYPTIYIMEIQTPMPKVYPPKK